MRTQMRDARATTLRTTRVSKTSFTAEKTERPCQDTIILGKVDNRGQHFLRLVQPPPIEGAQVIAQANCDNNVRESGQ
jgi:hypothetical protein